MSSEQQVGRHSLRFEDGIISVTLRGDFTLEDAQGLTARSTPFVAAGRSVFLRVDMRQVNNVEPAVRKHMSDWHQQARVAGSVHFGGSKPLRIMASLVHNAVRLISRRVIPLVFAETEAEARLCIAGRRGDRRLAAGSPAT